MKPCETVEGVGYERHHAIVVTSWLDEAITKAHERALELARADMVSPITPPVMNGYRSFAVFPDGSKEWWEESDEGDTMRTALTDWLDGQRYVDGSTSLRWVEVQFGDDNGETKVIRDSDANLRAYSDGTCASSCPVVAGSNPKEKREQHHTHRRAGGTP